jgi:MoCo/4Fe-4S cofactor protein with predicted Tat translocation signal
MNETPSFPQQDLPTLDTKPDGAWWMSFQELRSPEEFAAVFHREFPAGASEWDNRLSRRRFLQLMSASIAFASMTGCRLPEQKIVPYTDQPEKAIPGNALHFATTLQINSSPRGVIVTQHEGRPTHISGNPLHPMNRGANDIWTGAAVLELYDPDRLQTVEEQGNATTWDAFAQTVVQLQDDLKKAGGANFCLLTGTVNSPTLTTQISQLLGKYPQAKWYEHEPLSETGFRTDQGQSVYVEIELAQADVIFALESDFLFDRPDSLALTRAFSQRRRTNDASQCNRLYVAESCPTITGAKADHRFAIPPDEFTELAHTLLNAIKDDTVPANSRWPWLTALINDLRQHPGRCVLLGGRALPSEAQHALAKANEALGALGKTISYCSPGPADMLRPLPLTDLVTRLLSGEVTTLLILGGNPVYDAPADFNFATLLDRIPLTIHHTLYANETSAHCRWLLNATHDLEAWGDARTEDGTLSLCQPLITPLYDGKSAIEVLSVFVQTPGIPGYDLVRGTWSGLVGESKELFTAAWHTWLRNGVIELPQKTSARFAAWPDIDPGRSSLSPPANKPGAQSLLLTFRPSASLWDGRHANSGWLQELPDPVTKLTWDNAALLSPATAQTLRVNDGDMVKLTANGTQLEVPVLIAPGHADRCITLPLGYGRTRSGTVGNGVGFNAYLLRRSDALWQVPPTDVERTGRTHPLARTQEHFRVQGRDLLHVTRIDDLPSLRVSAPPEPPMSSLYPNVDAHGHAWALTIDLNTCIGCNACIIACQSENNIPVVGKKQVLFGREMQWIRVDRYYQGPAENPRTHFQPVTCMQCENAPCEVVCPVAATLHDSEGLNIMVYNRCVGTRYCSNNCPYKVRRFNFFEYNEGIPESRTLGLNPNVTVRSRGVMEKCTYCVQRIEEARISARRGHRQLRGTDIVTACQSACPAEAIVFGDLNDPESVVSQNRKKPGHYGMLAELDTRPRTTYLEKRINPNPALEPREAVTPANEGKI